MFSLRDSHGFIEDGDKGVPKGRLNDGRGDAEDTEKRRIGGFGACRFLSASAPPREFLRGKPVDGKAGVLGIRHVIGARGEGFSRGGAEARRKARSGTGK